MSILFKKEIPEWLHSVIPSDDMHARCVFNKLLRSVLSGRVNKSKIDCMVLIVKILVKPSKRGIEILGRLFSESITCISSVVNDYVGSSHPRNKYEFHDALESIWISVFNAVECVHTAMQDAVCDPLSYNISAPFSSWLCKFNDHEFIPYFCHAVDQLKARRVGSEGQVLPDECHRFCCCEREHSFFAVPCFYIICCFVTAGAWRID
jgi:hypothetical protein